MSPQETEVVRPLDSAEVKDAIAQTIAEEVRASLDKTCWLYGMAWPKFKASWRIDVTLENFGEERETFVTGEVRTSAVNDEGIVVPDKGDLRADATVTVEGSVPYTPPNVVRKRHGMPIPTIVKRDDGSTEQKAVIFRRPGRPRRTTQEE